jgi:hypothetical protein
VGLAVVGGMKAVTGITAFVVLALIAGCGRPAPPVILPDGEGTLVAQWSLEGGFVSDTSNLISPPTLVVYSDGRAIVDADALLVLPRTEVTALVNDLSRHLAGLDTIVKPDSNVMIADGGTTVFKVLTAAGELQSVAAVALTDVDGYPAELLAADRQMRDPAERVKAGRTSYTAARVRMVVEPWTGEDSRFPLLWPASLEPPAGLGMSGRARSMDYGGADAATVVRELERNYWQGSYSESMRQLPDGTRIGVHWRYLLPDE